jgi:hypothetical protein
MIKFNKEDIVQRRATLSAELKDKVCIVEFKKVDGTLREMPCTLSESIIPPAPVHMTNTDNPIDFPKVKKVNPEVMSVWCTDKGSWRSFRLENVISIKPIEE